MTELVTLGGNLTSNSTLNYRFTTQANLSVPGSYTFNATVSVAGDISPANDSFTGYLVTNTAPSVGGTVSGGTDVCLAGNSGVLTLSGHTGNVARWEFSTDGGSTWINIPNTTTFQSYLNLVMTTRYRALVQSGSCASVYSSNAVVTVSPLTVGGSIAPAAPAGCAGANAGTLTLSGQTGTVVRCELSTDGGINWTNIASTTTSQSYTNLATTTIYRTRVQSGTCAVQSIVRLARDGSGRIVVLNDSTGPVHLVLDVSGTFE